VIAAIYARKRSAVGVLGLIVFLAVPGLTAEAKSPDCPKPMMREIDEMNRLYLEAGRRYAAVLFASCDENGRVTELLLMRQRDGKKIKWRAEQGPAALARIILSGAER
jgi:hypothetical protein